MKRVLVIVPFPMSEENRNQRRLQLEAVELGPDIAFDFESVRVAPRNYVSASDMTLADFGLLEAGLEAQRRGSLLTRPQRRISRNYKPTKTLFRIF